MSGSIFTLASVVIACCARVAQLPGAGESVRADAVTVEVGGKGFNVAVGVHRLGATVEGLLVVGNDFLGTVAVRAADDLGLPRGMILRRDLPTGCGVAFIDSSGENRIAVCAGANAALCVSDVETRRQSIERACLILAQFEVEDAPIIGAFAIAREAGRCTVLNPSPYRTVHPDLLAACDVMVVNRIEAWQLAHDQGVGDRSEPAEFCRELAAALLARGPHVLVVTDGANGAWCVEHGGQPIYQPPFPVAPVDTVGAGDAFMAGLAVSIAAGRSWSSAMRRAAACGAIVASKCGVAASLPTGEELDAFLQDAERPPRRA